MKVVFFGTPPFAANLLAFLIDSGINIVAVVTKPDKPKGRSGTPIANAVKLQTLALKKLLPLFQPELASSEEFAKELQKFDADIFVVVAYGEIIKQHLLDMPRYGCINVHASILPKLRGAAPIQRSIIEGESETGVTIMQMVRKMDAGDIIKIAKTAIDSEISYGELDAKLCELAKEPLLEVLKEYAQGKIPPHRAQDETLVTFAPKIELEECQVDWNNSAKVIHNLVRGTQPEPGSWCLVDIKGEKKRLKIHKSQVRSELSGPIGNLILTEKNALIIGCGTNALQLLEVQLEGKKRINAAEFFSQHTQRHPLLLRKNI